MPYIDNKPQKCIRSLGEKIKMHLHCKVVALGWISCIVQSTSVILFLPQLTPHTVIVTVYATHVRMCIVLWKQATYAYKSSSPVSCTVTRISYTNTLLIQKRGKCLYQFVFCGDLKFHLVWCRHAVIASIRLVQRRVYSRTHILSRSSWVDIQYTNKNKVACALKGDTVGKIKCC